MAGRISYYGNIVTDGLVMDMDAGKRDSYPGSGTAWSDISGNGRNGTLTNGPTYSSANNGSIVFDGIDDYCVFNYTWPNAFTLNIWLYYIAGSGTYPRIISSADLFNFEIAINSSGQLSYYPSLVGTWTDNVATVSKNQWINLVAIDDNDTFTIYNNASLIYTGTIGTQASSTQIFIGQSFAGTQRTNIRVSNLQIYNRALLQTEVLQNYNALKGRYGL